MRLKMFHIDPAAHTPPNAQSMFKTARRSPFLNAAGKLATLHSHDEET